MNRYHSGRWVILLSFVVAYMLTIMPLPPWATLYRPEWVVLVLIYWCLALPERVGIVMGWLVGLLLDVLIGTTLGQHALALALVAYITLRWQRLLRHYTLWQQAFNALFLVVLVQLLEAWVQGVDQRLISDWSFWMPSVTSMLLWPGLFVALRNLQYRFIVR